MKQPNKQPQITILIHGTRPFAVLPESIDRISPHVVSNFFYGPIGFIKANEHRGNEYFIRVVKALSESDPNRFPIESFYLFGWSGRLTPKDRRKAASDLYKELKNNFSESPLRPTLRIITHSHGGNVALHLSEIASEDPNFVIDELILLACPVQSRTIHLTKSPIFKKIFSIYSKADIFQIIDPQGLYSLKEELRSALESKSLLKAIRHLTSKQIFSSRRFPRQNNLSQVRLVLNNHDPYHLEFLFLRFMRALPKILSNNLTSTGGSTLYVTIDNETIDIKSKRDSNKK